jgi:TRAP-type C4-dicarboxylate transport system substrate-binding protein
VAVVVDGGRLAVFQNEFGGLGAPLLASGYDGIRKVVTSDIFEEWVTKPNDGADLQVLSFNCWQGERHLLTKKTISGPADLAGIRMRTPRCPGLDRHHRCDGRNPDPPLPWAEVYSAISSNLIDGAEAQFPAITGAKLDEVITHITKTGHINLITGVVTSGGWFNSLPADLQNILRDVLRAMAAN